MKKSFLDKLLQSMPTALREAATIIVLEDLPEATISKQRKLEELKKQINAEFEAWMSVDENRNSFFWRRLVSAEELLLVLPCLKSKQNLGRKLRQWEDAGKAVSFDAVKIERVPTYNDRSQLIHKYRCHKTK